MKLDAAGARRGIEERVAKPLGVSLIEAVWGIHDLINETMAAAAKTHIAERGGNPQLVTVAAFGGAGPVHAFGLARKLGAPRMLVPPNAGVGSATGFFTAPRAFDLMRSHKVPFAAADFAKLEALLRELEAEGERTLRKAGATGPVSYARSIEARFIGQGSETTLPVPERDFTLLDAQALRRRFDQAYERLYGRTYPESSVEFVSFRVRASLPVKLLELPKIVAQGRASDALKGERKAFCGAAREYVPHAVYDRYRLPAGAELAGPAIFEERESTVIVGAGAARGWTISASCGWTCRRRRRMKRRLDPITLEILWRRLISIVDEADAAVARTAFSSLLRDAHDYTCMFTDSRGRELAQGTLATPGQSGAMALGIKQLVQALPPGAFKPGDVYITNDPWALAGHLNDVCVLSPIFHRGRLVAFTACILHHSDIGGRVASDNREVYEEGLFIPLVKLYDEGQLNEGVLAMICANVRTPSR